MKRIVLLYGSIAGGIIITVIVATMPLFSNGTLHINSLLAGYAVMVAALSITFFGIKSYRDKVRGGVIKFGKAFQVGLLIALVATVVYAAGWEVNLKLFAPDFIETYTAQQLAKKKASGATAEELEKAVKSMERMKEIYGNPFARFGMTMIEILPVGIVVSLVCAAILRKKEFLPTT